MTNFVTTKRALLTSVLSLVLCFAMLLGTTFAWFTDTVTSSGNVIQVGDLDVELYQHTSATEKVKSLTAISPSLALQTAQARIMTLQIPSGSPVKHRPFISPSLTKVTLISSIWLLLK
jgi:predicted ribosomally synthesized peptide with SipW-like signal peptide